MTILLAGDTDSDEQGENESTHHDDDDDDDNITTTITNITNIMLGARPSGLRDDVPRREVSRYLV